MPPVEEAPVLLFFGEVDPGALGTLLHGLALVRPAEQADRFEHWVLAGHADHAGAALDHALAHPGRARGIVLLAARAPEAGREGAVGALGLPVLALDTEADPDGTRALAALLPVERHVLASAGTVPWLELPGTTWFALRTFLRRLAR